MAGMYPNNQSIDIFGEQIQWPGVDASGKFTNGSFSDPMEKPSFIPADTINLILDNLAALITEMGGTPNNTGANQLATLFTAAKLLEKIQTVDGAASGLDADKLDGQEGSYYASTDALALKAPLANPALTGTPTAPTADASTNNTQIATTAFVRAAITALINSSPAALDTLKELADALGNDANFAATVTNALALKAPLASIRGFLSIGLTNMDNSSAPQITQGSQVEVGGSIYTAGGTVAGTPTANSVNYIYAVPSGSAISFSYSSTNPTWNAGNAGWYNGNNRAVAVFYLAGSLYYRGKRTLGGSSDDLIPTSVGDYTTGGTLVDSIIDDTHEKIVALKKGFYRIEIAGSRGGNGGAGDKSGGIGAKGGYINVTLYINHDVTATIFASERGTDGQSGGYGDGSSNPNGRVGGGGGGGGGTSGFICMQSLIFLFAFGGGGGGGGGSDDTGSSSNQDNGGSGGGGGGGSGSNGGQGEKYYSDYETTLGRAGTGGEAGGGGIAWKGGNGGKAGRVYDNLTLPEGGYGRGYEYSPPFIYTGHGGSGGKGGKGEDAIYGTDAEAGESGKSGGNSIDSLYGNSPSDNGFVKIYRVA